MHMRNYVILETNHAYEKRLPNYVIQKLITNLKKDLCNPEYTEGYFWKYENLWKSDKNIWRCRKKQPTFDEFYSSI